MEEITEEARVELIAQYRKFVGAKHADVENVSVERFQCQEEAGSRDSVDRIVVRYRLQEVDARLERETTLLGLYRFALRELEGGWNCTCKDCGVSLLPRIQAGHPMQHCMRCKEELECSTNAALDK